MISKDQLQSKISVEQDHLVKTDSRNAARSSTGTVLEAENKQIKDLPTFDTFDEFVDPPLGHLLRPPLQSCDCFIYTPIQQ